MHLMCHLIKDNQQLSSFEVFYMNYKIICDFNENYDSKTDVGHINDHQTKESFEKINSAINRLGYKCDIFGGVSELIKAYNENRIMNNNDIYINLSDGTDKKYSRVQVPVLCDLLNLKYSGGGTFETALTSNKFYSSLAVRDYGLLAPKSFLVKSEKDLTLISNGKYIVKPNSEGSSIGINSKSVCNTISGTKAQAKNLLQMFSEVLVEEYVPGYDATCFVIGNETIFLNEPLLIRHHNKLIFDNEVMGYEEHANKTREFISCENILSKKTKQTLQKISIEIKNLFNINDFCRIDYRITENFNVYFLEINTVPAISMQSQVGDICKNLNITFEDFIEKIIITITSRFNHE